MSARVPQITESRQLPGKIQYSPQQLLFVKPGPVVHKEHDLNGEQIKAGIEGDSSSGLKSSTPSQKSLEEMRGQNLSLFNFRHVFFVCPAFSVPRKVVMASSRKETNLVALIMLQQSRDCRESCASTVRHGAETDGTQDHPRRCGQARQGIAEPGGERT